ncbi:MAG: nucleoside triphosphate pyrophosphohydrolase, partial [Candidatus Binataceae bacterium]
AVPGIADMSGGDKFAQLFDIVRELRMRCPWDREQTLSRLAAGLVEEAYEALDSTGRGETAALIDELGDVLVQVLFAAVIGSESNRFNFDDIVSAATAKLIRRHPHVYGDSPARNSAEALANWERVKREEREGAEEGSALDGMARTLPALIIAEKLGVRTRAAGFDWPDIRGVIAKVREELDETEAALADGDQAAAAAELGDAMLALANAPRFLGRSADAELRAASRKFAARFKRMEEIAKGRHLKLKGLSDAELDSLWNEAKRGDDGSA